MRHGFIGRTGVIRAFNLLTKIQVNIFEAKFPLIFLSIFEDLIAKITLQPKLKIFYQKQKT